jgi:hypothetical protein
LDYGKDIRPVIEKHCFSCHGPDKGKGGVRLHEFADTKSLFRDPKLWEKVIESMRDEAMPPDDKPQPGTDERTRVVEWLEHTLDNPTDEMVPKDPAGPSFIGSANVSTTTRFATFSASIRTRPMISLPTAAEAADSTTTRQRSSSRLSWSKSISPQRPGSSRKPNRNGYSSSGRTEQLTKDEAARKVIEQFLPRAFRRPVEPDETARFHKLYSDAAARGESWEDAVKSALRAALVSPTFCFAWRFRERRKLTHWAISSWPAGFPIFLWSSMPDSELFELAAKQRLRDPAVLESQVKRLLQDPKARDFRRELCRPMAASS